MYVREMYPEYNPAGLILRGGSSSGVAWLGE